MINTIYCFFINVLVYVVYYISGACPYRYIECSADTEKALLVVLELQSSGCVSETLGGRSLFILGGKRVEVRAFELVHYETSRVVRC